MIRKKLFNVIVVSGIILILSSHHFYGGINSDAFVKGVPADCRSESALVEDRLMNMLQDDKGPLSSGEETPQVIKRIKENSMETITLATEIKNDKYTSKQNQNVAPVAQQVTTVEFKTDTTHETVIEDRIKEAFVLLLQQQEEGFRIIHEGTCLNKAIFLEGDLFLDFSEEILQYGGNEWEKELVNQLLQTAFSNVGVESVTITIDEQTKEFVEGTVINLYTRENWNERNLKNDE